MTGDITATVNADGWSVNLVVAGFTRGAAYSFGFDSTGMPSSTTPYLSVTTTGYDASKSVTTPVRTAYLTSVVRFPYGTVYLAGTYGAGTFADGETITQSVSGATGIVVGSQASGTRLYFRAVTGTFNNVNVCTGGTSGATFTSTSTITTPTLPTNDELADVTPNLTVRVALSTRVRSTDTVTITAPSGFIVNAGGSSQNSTTTTAVAVTNSSTQTHPAAFGQWAQRPYERWQSNPTLAVSARHIYGVSAVDIILTDTNSNTVTTAATLQTRLRSATGLYATEWAATCDLSTLTQGSVITARYVIYPNIGDSAATFDSTNQPTNDNNLTLGICNFPYWNDKNASADVYAVVNFSTGVDASGVSSSTLATANASPYLTIGKALSVGTANIIYIRSGTGGVLGSTVTAPSSLGYWRQIKVYPGDGTVTLQIAAVSVYNTPHLSYEGVTIQLNANTSTWFDGVTSVRYISFLNCMMDANGKTSNGVVSSFGYRSACAYLFGNTFTDGSKFGLANNLVIRVAHWFDGNLIPCVAATHPATVYRFVGNSTTNFGVQTSKEGATTAPLSDPLFIESNKLLGITSGATAGINAYTQPHNTVYGISFVNNVVETSSGTQISVKMFGDGNTTTAQQIVFWHNTVTGQRLNLCYNETTTVSYLKNNVSFMFNALAGGTTAGGVNIKTDNFGTPNGNRVGNWAILYGVDCMANAEVNSIGFNQAYTGFGCTGIMDNTGQASSSFGICRMSFAADNSVVGSGTGLGDYRPQAGTALRGRVPASYEMPGWDLRGNPYSQNGNGTMGAYQLAGGSSFV